MRWIIECEWSGYTSGQRRICHRKVITNKRAAERLGSLHTVQFTDGTTMSVTVRPCTLREKVEERNGYGSLLDDLTFAGFTGFANVADLIAREKEISL